MAASTQTNDMTTCPLPGCDYEGSARSVESHISGKTDDVHRGEVGRTYRDELESDGPEDRPDVDVESVDQWDLEPDEEPDETSENEGEEGNEESPPSDGEAPSGATDTPETDPEGGEVPGIPIPFDKTTLALVLVLIVVLALLYRQGYFASDDEDDQDETDGGAEEAEEAAAGLIGA